MATLVNAELLVNVASTILTFNELTGVYNAITNPGGYGVPNKTTAANVFTRYDFTFPDDTTYRVDTDATTLPTTDFVPRNALTREFTLAQLGLTGTEFPAGVIQVNYKPYFNTASGGDLTFTQNTNVVVAASGQDLTIDYSDSSMVLWKGVEYTIVAGSLVTGQFTLSAVYTGATDTDEGFVGYSKATAVLIPKEFLDCWSPQWSVLDVTDKCQSAKEKSLSHLYNIYLSVQAKMAETDYDGANDLLLDLIALCECENTTGGCC